MGLETAFIPENLIEARRLITAAHDHSETGETGLSEETKYLVERILKTGKPMLYATAVSLSDRDVGRLAGYIPYNYM